MARIKKSVPSRARRKRVLEQSKGFRGRSKNCFSIAIERLEKSLQYAYRDRRNRKRDFRGLWIQRINAGSRLYGMTYSQFMNGLKKASIEIDRKVLSDLAIHQAESFKQLVEQAKAAL